MKQIFAAILLLFLIINCDGIEEGIIDPSDESFVVNNISAPTELVYSGEDTKLLTSISFSSIESVQKVWYNLSSEDGFIQKGSVNMSAEDTVSSSYFGSSGFSIDDPTGIYVVEYYVNTSVQIDKKIASHSFYYDNTKDVTFENLTAPTEFIYSSLDPFLRTAIRLSNTYNLQNVWIKIESSDSPFVIIDSLQLMRAPNGSPYYITTYYDSLKMSPSYPNGNYNIDYYIKTTTNDKQIIKTHSFSYIGEGKNTPPEISNPLFYYEDENPILRDTLENNKPFIFSIDVVDANGLSDIDSVYTDFYSPNNPSAFRVLMFDDGDEAHGDLVAGDGIYSFKNIFQNAQGERKFEFWARDRAGDLSNMITHNVVVK